MHTVFHQAKSRGHVDHGWLDTWHTFSFASYFARDRMHFGALRVLNDDVIAPSVGFDTHPHDNMEIITIPLEGELEHEDSMHNKEILKPGEIQVMTAGAGITHSERNPNAEVPVKLLQIWVYPNERDLTPRYETFRYENLDMKNRFAQLVSPSPEDEGSWVHQDTWFYLGNFEAGHTENYVLQNRANGVYAFVIEGSISLGDRKLERRDGLGISDTGKIQFTAQTDSRILFMEVPMAIP